MDHSYKLAMGYINNEGDWVFDRYLEGSEAMNVVMFPDGSIKRLRSDVYSVGMRAEYVFKHGNILMGVYWQDISDVCRAVLSPAKGRNDDSEVVVIPIMGESKYPELVKGKKQYKGE